MEVLLAVPLSSAALGKGDQARLDPAERDRRRRHWRQMIKAVRPVSEFLFVLVGDPSGLISAVHREMLQLLIKLNALGDADRLPGGSRCELDQLAVLVDHLAFRLRLETARRADQQLRPVYERALRALLRQRLGCPWLGLLPRLPVIKRIVMYVGHETEAEGSGGMVEDQAIVFAV